MRGWQRAAGTAAGLGLSIGLSACGGQPAALPTIGSPSPSPSAAATDEERAAELAERWDLLGVPLPADWPDVPLPAGTEVVTAYAIGAEPRRTWTATFAADRGTALDLAEPVVAELREREYVPIAEYVGAAATNTGLYSFAAPTFAIYVVLGEDNGRPNLVITVRGSRDESAGLPEGADPLVPRGAEGTAPATGSPNPTASPNPSGSPTRSPVPSGSPRATRSPAPSGSATSPDA